MRKILAMASDVATDAAALKRANIKVVMRLGQDSGGARSIERGCLRTTTSRQVRLPSRGRRSLAQDSSRTTAVLRHCDRAHVAAADRLPAPNRLVERTLSSFGARRRVNRSFDLTARRWYLASHRLTGIRSLAKTTTNVLKPSMIANTWYATRPRALYAPSRRRLVCRTGPQALARVGPEDNPWRNA